VMTDLPTGPPTTVRQAPFRWFLLTDRCECTDNALDACRGVGVDIIQGKDLSDELIAKILPTE
jgi:hypothetical protein